MYMPHVLYIYVTIVEKCILLVLYIIACTLVLVLVLYCVCGHYIMHCCIMVAVMGGRLYLLYFVLHTLSYRLVLIHYSTYGKVYRLHT